MILKNDDWNLENSTYLDDVAYYIYRIEMKDRYRGYYLQAGFFCYEKTKEYYKKAEKIVRKEKLEELNYVSR